MNQISTSKNPTIADREEEIQSIIASVQHLSLQSSADTSRALLLRLRETLFPVGYRVKVQLEENGRKKRSTADASYWSFHSGEMVLFFEPNPDVDAQEQTVGPQSVPPKMGLTVASKTSEPAVRAQADSYSPPATVLSLEASEIQQCVQALEDVEKQGKQFVAYKWFRDLYLAALPYSWAKDAERRQRVLGAAVEGGMISLQKIPNPRSPMFPTTTLSINRTAPGAGGKSRFSPVQAMGEPVSTTLLRDRG